MNGFSFQLPTSWKKKNEYLFKVFKCGVNLKVTTCDGKMILNSKKVSLPFEQVNRNRQMKRNCALKRSKL